MQLNKEKAVAIAQTTATLGWSYLKEFMNDVLRRAQEDLIEMDDAQKAEQVRMGLKYTRQWRDALFAAAESLASYDEGSIEDFSNLTFPTGDQHGRTSSN